MPTNNELRCKQCSTIIGLVQSEQNLLFKCLCAFDKQRYTFMETLEYLISYNYKITSSLTDIAVISSNSSERDILYIKILEYPCALFEHVKGKESRLVTGAKATISKMKHECMESILRSQALIVPNEYYDIILASARPLIDLCTADMQISVIKFA